MFCSVEKWRKHKCTLFILRYFLKSKNYQSFLNFRFEDYLQRDRVIKTYNIRHLKMTQGESSENYGIPEPKEWSEEISTPTPIESGTTNPSISSTPTGKKNLRYDSEEEAWVEIDPVPKVTKKRSRKQRKTPQKKKRKKTR